MIVNPSITTKRYPRKGYLGQPKEDVTMCKVYDVINSRIMELLEQGTVPWRKTWRGNAASNQPKNLVSKKEYRGINLWILGSSPFSSPYWVTYKQAADKGGHVIKGSKSTPVVFWKWIDRKEGNGADSEETDGKGKMPMLRLYNLFNLQQVEGVEPPPATETTITTFTPIETAQQIIDGMPLRPEIKHGGSSASYSPMWDRVKMPEPTAFATPEEYYCTLFHELTHSTGHARRVGRKGIIEINGFGSNEYSKEELCAAMGEAFLCGHAGIEQKTIENSAAYIAGWLKALKNDKMLLVHAAAQAQKAADFILNRKGGEENDVTDDSAA
jgi:antirestriction protein ArdC